MSRLRMVAGKSFDDLLAVAPGAQEADTEMRSQLIERLTPRLYSLIGLAVAGLLGCERFVENLRGPLDSSFALQAAQNWRKLALTKMEKAVLAYTEIGTIDEASVRLRHVEALREAGLSDKDVLIIATTIAYHNYSIRLAAAFDVTPR